MCINYQGSEDGVMAVLSMWGGGLPGISEDKQEPGRMRRTESVRSGGDRWAREVQVGDLEMLYGICQENVIWDRW